MNDGKYYEKLVEQVFKALKNNEKYSKVERDVKLSGPDGELRQIDVLLETELFGIKSTALVECRDYKVPLNISHVDGFHSKVQDLPGDIAILISRKGFSSNATKKAKRRNIKLFTLDKSTDVAGIGIDLRLLLLEIVPTRVSFQFLNNSGSTFKGTLRQMRFNGFPLIEFIRRGLESNMLKIPRDHAPIVWPDKSGELILTGVEGQRIAEAVVSIEYELQYYQGYLSDLEDTLILKNLNEGKTNIVYFVEEIKSSLHKFEKIDSQTKITLPAGQAMRIHLLVPNIEISSIGGTVENRDGTTGSIGDAKAMENFDALPLLSAVRSTDKT